MEAHRCTCTEFTPSANCVNWTQLCSKNPAQGQRKNVTCPQRAPSSPYGPHPRGAGSGLPAWGCAAPTSPTMRVSEGWCGLCARGCPLRCGLPVTFQHGYGEHSQWGLGTPACLVCAWEQPVGSQGMHGCPQWLPQPHGHSTGVGSGTTS